MCMKTEPSKEAIANARQWKATRDEKTGKTFYYHRGTMESQWDKPPGFDEAQREKKAEKAANSRSDGTRSFNVICYESNVVHKNASSSTTAEGGNDDDDDDVRAVDKPTALFQYLQLKCWSAASRRVRHRPREARIWVGKGGYYATAQGKWKVLPLHAAIILGAPSCLIIEILDAHPDAARMKDMNGSLPLHLAACGLVTYINGEQVFEVLLSAYPEARYIEDNNGHTPVKILQHSQRGRDETTKRKLQSILDNLTATETVNEGVEIQLEVMPGKLRRSSAGTTNTGTSGANSSSDQSGVSSLSSNHTPPPIPDNLEFVPSILSKLSGTYSGLDNPSRSCSSVTVDSDLVQPATNEHESLQSSWFVRVESGCSVATEPPTPRNEIGTDEIETTLTCEKLDSIDESRQLDRQGSSRGEERLTREPRPPHPADKRSSDDSDLFGSKAKTFLKSKLVCYKLRSPPLGLRKFRSEGTPNGGIMHSKSLDLLYDYVMTSNMFPPYANRRAVPTIDKGLPFLKTESRTIKEGGIDDEECRDVDPSTRGAESDVKTDVEAKQWREALDETTKKTYYYRGRTREIRRDKPLGVDDARMSREVKKKNSAEYGEMTCHGSGSGTDASAESDRDASKDKASDAGSQRKSLSWELASFRSQSSSKDCTKSGRNALEEKASVARSQDASENWELASFGSHFSNDPTVLFLHMYQQDWASSLSRLRDHPEDASVWIQRKADEGEYFLWNLLPLHASIVLGAPSSLILEMLFAHPDAARERDGNGSLPVHLAASRMNSLEDGEGVLHHLTRIFPDSVGIKDGMGRTTTEIVRMNGGSVVDDTIPKSIAIVEPENDFASGHGETAVGSSRCSENDPGRASSGRRKRNGSLRSSENATPEAVQSPGRGATKSLPRSSSSSMPSSSGAYTVELSYATFESPRGGSGPSRTTQRDSSRASSESSSTIERAA